MNGDPESKEMNSGCVVYSAHGMMHTEIHAVARTLLDADKKIKQVSC